MRTFVALISTVLIALTATAQQPLPGGDLESAPKPGVGPAGNAHPEVDLVGVDPSQVTNPFGNPDFTGPFATTQELEAFASALDLTPLRDLAVFHGGRVKIIDTLATETIRTLTGKGRYAEPYDTSDLTQGEAKFDAVFTWLDLIIDPVRYLDKPLIAVDYLPLREAYLDAAFPGDETAKRMWKTTTRVSPIMVERFTQSIFESFGDEQPFRQGIGSVERGMTLLGGGVSNLLLVAPDSSEDPWPHLGALDDSSPAALAAAELGVAWRARDAEGVNAAVAELASILPTINAEVYPTSRRSLELAYNDANAFEYGMWVYLLSLVSLVLAFGTNRKWLRLTGTGLLVLGVLIHGVGFALRCVIAERFAIQNQFESMTGLSFFASIVGLGLLAFLRQPLFGAASAAVGFLALIFATQTGIPGETIEREAAILNTSVLLKYHVTTVLTSYGLITLGFVVSLFYLGTHYAARFGARDLQVVGQGALAVGGSGGGAGDGTGHGSGDEDTTPTTARTLADLDTAQMVVLQLAFWTLGVGILLGAWWADHSWGRWWAWDPKETWALITWIVYLIVIHVRVGGGAKRKGLTTAWLSVIGWVVMLWTYFGVNLLLPGLHAYA
ncbi:MAG: cytochrome c biogenesis protein CcsA [Planctomycetota bacterium]